MNFLSLYGFIALPVLQLVKQWKFYFGILIKSFYFRLQYCPMLHYIFWTTFWFAFSTLFCQYFCQILWPVINNKVVSFSQTLYLVSEALSDFIGWNWGSTRATRNRKIEKRFNMFRMSRFFNPKYVYKIGSLFSERKIQKKSPHSP